MPYSTPTPEDLKRVYTEFLSAADDAVEYWIARAERVIDSDFGDDQTHATITLAAHYLVQQGLGTGAESQRASEFGGANKVKSGSLELGWPDGAKAKGSNKSSTGSRYGDEVRALIIAVKGGPRVCSTGAFPPRINMGGLHGYS